MSLVNEMLNDLQRDQKDPISFQGMVATNKQPNYYKIIVFITTFLGLVFIGYYFFVGQQEQELQHNNSSFEALPKKNIQNTTERAKPSDSIYGSTDKNKSISISSEDKDLVIPKEKITKIEKSETKLTKVTENIQPTTREIKTNQLNVIKPKNNMPIETQAANQSKVVAKQETLIKVSRKTLAEKELLSITNQWKTLGSSLSFNQLKVVLNRYADLPTVWLKSLNFIKRKQPEFYDQLLSEALNQFPKNESFLLLSAKHLFSSSQFEQAQQQLDKTDSNNWSLTNYRLAALLAQKLDNHPKAINYFQKITALSSSSGEINMAIGISYEAINKKDLSVRFFNSALLDPKLNPIQKQFIQQRLNENKD